MEVLSYTVSLSYNNMSLIRETSPYPHNAIIWPLESNRYEESSVLKMTHILLLFTSRGHTHNKLQLNS